MTTVAIVGGGAAGMGAAIKLLKAGIEVYLFEKGPRLGGDCFGVDVRMANGSMVRVDAGVSDFNQKTFVNVKELLDTLGLRYYPICQDASFMRLDGTTSWAVKDGKPVFYEPVEDEARLVGEMKRFREESMEVLADETYASHTLASYLAAKGYSDEFQRLYLYPRAAGCFPMPNHQPGDYLVRGIVSFWRMHGIVGKTAAERMVVEGGMHLYCDAVQRWFLEHGGRLFCGTRIIGVARRRKHIEIRASTKEDHHLAFKVDHVVFATNSCEVIGLLEDPADDLRAIYRAFPYQRARLVVHQDASVMPKDRAAWGGYNYLLAEGDEPEVRPVITFYPNLLARLPPEVPDIFVTMNPHVEMKRGTVIIERFFEHPVSIPRTRELAAQIEAYQGRDFTWFCGSYLLDPYVHEQAYVSGINVANRMLTSTTLHRNG